MRFERDHGTTNGTMPVITIAVDKTDNCANHLVEKAIPHIRRDDGSIPEHGDIRFRPMTELSQAETESKQNTDRRQQVGRLLRLATYASVSVAMTLIVLSVGTVALMRRRVALCRF